MTLLGSTGFVPDLVVTTVVSIDVTEGATTLTVTVTGFAQSFTVPFTLNDVPAFAYSLRATAAHVTATSFVLPLFSVAFTVEGSLGAKPCTVVTSEGFATDVMTAAFTVT